MCSSRCRCTHSSRFLLQGCGFSRARMSIHCELSLRGSQTHRTSRDAGCRTSEGCKIRATLPSTTAVLGQDGPSPLLTVSTLILPSVLQQATPRQALTQSFKPVLNSGSSHCLHALHALTACCKVQDRSHCSWHVSSTMCARCENSSQHDVNMIAESNVFTAGIASLILTGHSPGFCRLELSDCNHYMYRPVPAQA